MFPRVKEIRTNEFNQAILNFYTENYSIKIDKEKCIGCGLCIKACPNKAYTLPKLEGKIRITTENLIPDIPNQNLCSYCGTCAYLCPTSAISLKYNDKVIGINDLGLITKNVVPKLKFSLTTCKNASVKAKVFLKGEIGVDWEKCISCMSCVDVCPSGAFFKTETKKQENSKKKVSFDQTKCISCGTCVRACSKKAISLTINDINYSGPYKKVFWESLVNRIKTQF
ncbi:MAG: 4Fe-4S binding protein [Candidatus Thorarchaeota archaeon]